MSDIISVQDLNLWYGNHQALHHINMEIPEKSITAFIGPSGCGKSTLLKTLNRMNDLVKGVRITGNVFYLGQDIYAPEVEVSELRRQIKYELLPSQRVGGKCVERPLYYIADFVYTQDGETVVEDVKGYRDPASAGYAKYVIKRKLMLYRYGIRVREV